MREHGDVGYLTFDQFDRFRRAVHQAQIVVPWFRVAGYIRNAVANDRINTSVDHPLGLPPTWLAAEEISRLSGELRYWPDLEDVANDLYGQNIALQFTHEVETAMHRWPIEDRSHRVQHVRCQKCAGETIRYDPPQYPGDDTHIACTECGRNYDDEELKELVELVTSEMKRTENAIGGTRRLGAA